MSRDERTESIEAVASAYRQRDAQGRIHPSAAWWDLAPEARERAFDLQTITREMERAMDAREWSGTVRAVLARL